MLFLINTLSFRVSPGAKKAYARMTVSTDAGRSWGRTDELALADKFRRANTWPKCRP
jgi:hypothetical protein